jgi:predicted alpha/beta-fold hydrolase
MNTSFSYQDDVLFPFRAPSYLFNGHIETLYAALCLSRPHIHYQRERWDTPDGDFIDIDFVRGKPNQPLVVLFHGLEGSSNSHYARAFMHALTECGWQGAIPHFRSCSGEINRAPRFYHSGDATEIEWLLQRLRTQTKTLYVIGFSLGGNALLRYLGEAQHSADFINAACSVSAPLDLAQSGNALLKGFNQVYTRHFLKTLKLKCIEKLKQYPHLFHQEKMLRSRNLYEFDNIVTAPLHGYQNTEDYWERASAKNVLNDITVPTLILNAQNDPFLPGFHLPQKASSHVTLAYPKQGGHVGFVSHHTPTQLSWLPKNVIQFFKAPY